MAADFRNQVDLTPATNPSPGLHVHVPNGSSASQFNDPSNPTASMSGPTKAGAVVVKINGTDKQQVKFCNPA
jgi:hypothetical protein